ncbi:hypothetical protein BT96DRAFT_1007226 [Gymnopus androsaceus JB14]|uniref:Uncharacterized protein n=1 Tax=Gymnopus androsaceus JB14 TaxID=1447944 RepID=A0A6A4GIS8_9AGAR|nr:hypothetical protein BT96DRAFT_1007226 [Gymnopus androsaceus JB14]
MPSTPVVSTPMPTEWKKWTIFTGPWSATYDYSPQLPMPSMFWSPSPPAPSSSLLPPAKPLEENIFGNAWILHPGLAGIEIAVDLKLDASLGSLGKKSQSMSKDSLTQMEISNSCPPATEKRLMVVAQNSLHHIGKLVCQIHHFYKNERTKKNHLLLLTMVEHPGLAEEIGHECLEMHPDDLKFVKETPAERKFSKGLLRDLRMEFSYSPVETRPSLQAYNSHAAESSDAAEILNDPVIPGSLSSPWLSTWRSKCFTIQMQSLHLDECASPQAKDVNHNTRSVSGVTAQMASLYLEEPPLLPTAQGVNLATGASSTNNLLETLITASELLATPMDTLAHNKLFTSSTEFYQHHSVGLPSMRSLDPSEALTRLNAVANMKRVMPAYQPGCSFGRMPTPNPMRQTRSPSPSLPPTKIHQKEAQTLQLLKEQFKKYHHQVFNKDFASQMEEVQQRMLDEVNTWLERNLVTLGNLEERARERRKRQRLGGHTSDPENNHRNLLEGCMTNLYGKICALYAPLIPKEPIEVNAYCLDESTLPHKDQINQILILLAVICSLVIGLSFDQCNFLIGIAVMLVKLGMSTTGKQEFFHFPESCNNDIVGKEGTHKCGANLLTKQRDDTIQPIKPCLIPSFTDYIACCLQDPVYLNQSTEATNAALKLIRTGNASEMVQNAFKANFIQDFKGPDGKLFVNHGDKIRLAFSIHIDFFNPNHITHQGTHASIGVVLCANLALNALIRYLPEYLYQYLIPGPVEPDYDKLDHYLQPILEDSESGAAVKAGILLSVNDLPAARKAAGFLGPMSDFICTVCNLRGKHHIFNVNHDHWPRQSVKELCHSSEAYRNAQTLSERKKILQTHGV